MRIGVDVGGTHTDAALVDGRRVLATLKTPTTADVETGVIMAIRNLLGQSGIAPSVVTAVIVGTRQFRNAFAERRHLNEVALLRLVPPAWPRFEWEADWPPDLAWAIGRRIHHIGGVHPGQSTGGALFDERAVATVARMVRREGIPAIAVSSLFPQLDARMEQRVAEILRAEVPEARISLASDLALGHDGGTTAGREAVAIMNAALAALAERVAGSFREALRSLGLTAPFFFTRNDGAVLDHTDIERFPALTFLSGPANSLRGAAFLSNFSEYLESMDTVAVDIGATTTHVAGLVKGRPRKTLTSVRIGGLWGDFHVPDMRSINLGGGSLVVECPVNGPSRTRIGPEAVGSGAPGQPLVFGGNVLTTTDIAVAIGAADIGDRSRVRNLSVPLITAAMAAIHDRLAQAVREARSSRRPLSPQDMAVIVVGGGSLLIDRPLRGGGMLLIPPHAGEAGAIGAAVAIG